MSAGGAAGRGGCLFTPCLPPVYPGGAPPVTSGPFPAPPAPALLSGDAPGMLLWAPPEREGRGVMVAGAPGKVRGGAVGAEPRPSPESVVFLG